jgi:hypothetical protein
MAEPSAVALRLAYDIYADAEAAQNYKAAACRIDAALQRAWEAGFRQGVRWHRWEIGRSDDDPGRLEYPGADAVLGEQART